MVFSKKNMDNTMSYSSFKELTRKLLSEGKTTGTNHTPAYLEYTRLNLKRIDRQDKKLILDPSLIEKVKKINRPQKWILIVEAWCGDVAQNLPAIAKMAAENDLIELKLILRDENLDVMDNYLTNGGRGIPKLIILDEYSNELATWGPRPAPIQELLQEYKEKNLPYKEYSDKAHVWYTKDKTITLQSEFDEIINSLLVIKQSKAA